MEENSNDIEKLKAMIKENFEEQRKLIARLETALEAVTSFNGQPGHAPDAESLRPDPDPLAQLRQTALFQTLWQDLLLGLGRTQVPEGRMPERGFYV